MCLNVVKVLLMESVLIGEVVGLVGEGGLLVGLGMLMLEDERQKG